MEFRNIHFTAPDSDASAPEPAPTMEAVAAALPEKMRLRKVTVSPLEEYALRPGRTRPISDALAACILSFKGRAEVTAKGIRIDRKILGREMLFHHEDSQICGDLANRERKWWYFINRQKPDRIHLFDDQIRYIETLPEKFIPHALNLEEQAASIAADKRVFNRANAHLQRLHGDDTYQKVQDMRDNAELATRYVQTLDAAAAVERLPAAEPVEGGTANRIATADRNFDQAVTRHASAVELGRALNSSRPVTPVPSADPVDAEDWTDTTASTSRHTTTQPSTEIESW